MVKEGRLDLDLEDALELEGYGTYDMEIKVIGKGKPAEVNPTSRY